MQSGQGSNRAVENIGEPWCLRPAFSRRSSPDDALGEQRISWHVNPPLREYRPTLISEILCLSWRRPASAVDQRRFTTARASTFDFSMRTDSS